MPGISSTASRSLRWNMSTANRSTFSPRGWSVRQKIALFLKVCEAVAYLHRHLIVHRDLKPSNIFVTADGEPKLLDFGIAKLLDLTTDTTVTGMRMLTPDYASPEQMQGGRLTTTTDVYSLGAVLYLLLTRKPAHEFDDRSPEAIAVGRHGSRRHTTEQMGARVERRPRSHPAESLAQGSAGALRDGGALRTRSESVPRIASRCGLVPATPGIVRANFCGVIGCRRPRRRS